MTFAILFISNPTDVWFNFNLDAFGDGVLGGDSTEKRNIKSGAAERDWGPLQAGACTPFYRILKVIIEYCTV